MWIEDEKEALADCLKAGYRAETERPLDERMAELLRRIDSKARADQD